MTTNIEYRNLSKRQTSRLVSEVFGYQWHKDHAYTTAYTRDIYMESFFYLTQRFGCGLVQDNYKCAGQWFFEVKGLQVNVYLNSSWVSFIVSGRKFVNVYGFDNENYENSLTRQASRTLKMFLNNMLTPIWVRDVPYNIKGQMSDEHALYYRRYENNVSINRTWEAQGRLL